VTTYQVTATDEAVFATFATATPKVIPALALAGLSDGGELSEFLVG
jgi:hypothetical protein